MDEPLSHSRPSGLRSPIFTWSARLGLAGVFLYAGTAKLANPGAFHQDVLNFQLIAYPLAAWIAIGLPALEVVCGVALLIPSWSRAAALILLGLLAAFLAALTRAWILGINLHCGCFGSSPDPVNYPWKVAQNCLLFLAALALSFGDSSAARFRSKGAVNDKQVA